MMEQTVRNGSAFNAFHDRAGRPYLPDIRVAGKTGTLEDAKTRTLYTWFVGFAPYDAEEARIERRIGVDDDEVAEVRFEQPSEREVQRMALAAP